MDDKCRDALRQAIKLVNDQQAVLGRLLPTSHDVARHMIEGRKPTPEKAQEWDRALKEVTYSMIELSAAVESVHQIADPLIRFDA